MGQQHVPLEINQDGLVTKVGHDIGGSYNYTTNIEGVSYDDCVICKKTTKYPTSTNIHQRFGYIEGMGQLCEDCYTAGTPAGREMITIPKHWVLGNPNDAELGAKIRAFYWENYGNYIKFM